MDQMSFFDLANRYAGLENDPLLNTVIPSSFPQKIFAVALKLPGARQAKQVKSRSQTP